MLAGVSLSSPYSGVSTAEKDRKNNFLSFFLQHYDITQNYRDAYSIKYWLTNRSQSVTFVRRA